LQNGKASELISVICFLIWIWIWLVQSSNSFSDFVKSFRIYIDASHSIEKVVHATILDLSMVYYSVPSD